ncbi:MAG: alpha/beta fold hydrolase [Planctomycetaceae bacterium]
MRLHRTGRTHLRLRRPAVLAVSLIAGMMLMAEPVSSTVNADEGPAEARSSEVKLPVTSKTLGGRQFWGDVHHLHGWRIQKNVITGHYRLLDPDDKRHSSGTLEECRARLETIRVERQLPPMQGKAVLLIHGLIRSSKSFHAMETALRNDGYAVVRFDYPSTRVAIENSAAFLHSVIESLGDEVTSIDVVAHSMGGIVLRSFLQHYNEPRLHRAVMLGVPNRGAEIADRFKNNALFKAVYGPAGTQLASGHGGIASELPIPEFEFGIIAGGRGAARGFNPLLPGDNDTTVTVRSARLPGASDFLLVPVLHSFLMASEEPVRATVYFLDHGRFSPDRAPHPITPDQPDEP